MKVRVTAAITKSQDGFYRVVLSNGVFSDYSTFEDAKRYADYVNNEDADNPEYMEVADEIAEQTYAPTSEELYERRMKERKEREEKKRKIEDGNRKSKKTSEKYVYVISMFERGCKNTEYFKGESDLLKFISFTTTKVEKAKVYQTKASAQKVIDALTKNYMVYKVYKSLKVVQKKRELFG